MSAYEQVDKAIWTDPDFESLSMEAGLLYLWSFTNLRCNGAGLYKVSERSMIESKVPQRRLKAAVGELATGRFLFHVEGVLWVRSRVKRLGNCGSKRAAGIAADVTRIDFKHPLRVAFLAEYAEGDDEGLAWLRPYLHLLKASPESVGAHTRPGYENLEPEGVSQVEKPSYSLVLSSTKSSDSSEIQELFDYWRAKLGKSEQNRLTDKRHKAVAGRLAEQYDAAFIRRAVDGVAKFPYNVEGKRRASGDGTQRFDDLELICRSGENLERFAALADATVTPLSPLGRKLESLDAMRQWIDNGGDDAA